MVWDRPSSSNVKSSLSRLRTICPCLSLTVARTLTTFTSVEKIVSWAPRSRPACGHRQKAVRRKLRRDTGPPPDVAWIRLMGFSGNDAWPTRCVTWHHAGTPWSRESQLRQFATRSFLVREAAAGAGKRSMAAGARAVGGEPADRAGQRVRGAPAVVRFRARWT